MALDLLLEVRKQGRWQGEMTGRRRNGDSFPAWLNMSAVPTEHDEQARVIGIFSDIGALRRAESELLHLAHHDPLTGLPNRLFAMERLEQAISRSRRKLQNTAVIMIDLDHFKHVNDSLGHAAGDELLREVSQRLKSCVRAEDTIARLGGDEFMLILEDIDQSHDVVQIADKLLRRLSEPAILGKSEIRASASLGVSLFPNDAQDSEAMLMASDTAMYAAKAAGRGRVEFYAQDMADRVKRKVRAEQDLRRGVAAGELRVHYQPQIAFADGRLVGAEALVRWQHPDRGLLSAFEVVPLAEESALIVEIGAFVLIEVCRQIRAWLDAGLACPPVAVNVSVHQLRSGRFPEFVARVLAEAGLGADRLELELTESTLQQEDICLPAMRALAQLGVALAIDDFGTGYSSLASLKRFPVSSCKIDRIFVSEIATDVGDAAIAAAIIDLGHRLKMQVIAEGVETETQFEVLRTLGCDRMQGYLIARPMAADDFGQLLLAADAPDKSLPFPRVAAPEKA
jgi:diguanylate cyclase (GGDEF)-like protein